MGGEISAKIKFRNKKTSLLMGVLSIINDKIKPHK